MIDYYYIDFGAGPGLEKPKLPIALLEGHFGLVEAVAQGQVQSLMSLGIIVRDFAGQELCHCHDVLALIHYIFARKGGRFQLNRSSGTWQFYQVKR